MVDFSLGEWLGFASKSSKRARKRPPVRSACIEGLEDRALLTANLPVAVNDVYTLTEDVALTNASTVLSNDTDLDGDTIDQAVINTGPSHGSLLMNTDGTFTYTPNANFNGTDSFTYFARDSAHDETGTVAGTVTLTVNAVNDAPTVTNVNLNTDEDVVLTGTLTGVDADNDPLQFSAGTTAATNGTITINPNGTFTFTPNANFDGTGTFSFVASDGTVNSNEGTATITINAVNDLPVGSPVGISTAEDTAFNGTLTATDAENDPLTFSAGAINATNGIVTINPDGTYTYTPNANFNGNDAFSFKVNDTHGDSADSLVTVVVDAVNDLPVVNSAAITTDEDAAFNGTLTATDAENDPLTFSAGTTVAANGVVTINPNGTFTYTPNANFNGTDSFTFKANDTHGDSTEGTISVTVTAVADTPIANATTINATEDIPFTGNLTATDADNDALTFSVGSTAAAHGVVSINPDGSFTYTPAANFHGTDSFSFKANDGTSNSADATVTVNVASVNDLPVVVNSAISATEDTPFTGTLTATDADNDAVTFSAGTIAATHGVVTINPDGSYTYTPDANFNGTDSFSFKANDGTGNSAEATITVNVAAVADVPVANTQTITLNEDTPFNGTLTATDADNDALTFLAGSVAAAHGTVTINPGGTFTYTPNANFNGSDTFSFKVNDGTSNSADATITVNVTAVNDLPTVTPVNVSTNVNTAVNGTLTASDAENDPLTFTAGATAAAHGTVTINPNGTFIYTPNNNFTGTDTFTFIANDTHGNSPEGTVTITVANGQNHLPVAQNANITTAEDTQFTGTLTATDADNNPLTFSAGAVAAQHGTVTINTNGSFTYTPDANFNGTDSFTFKANDGTGNSADATVNVTVTAVVDNPTGNTQTVTTGVGTAFTGTLTANNPDNQVITFVAGTTAPAHGTVTINPNGSFTFTPTAGFTGTDTFGFVVNNGTTNSAESLVTVNVTNATAPIAIDGSGTTGVDTPFSGSLTALVSSTQGANLTFTAVTQPTSGTLSLSADGNFLYTPNAGFTGSDSFTFKANDGTQDSNIATFTINVTNAPFTLDLSTTPGVIATTKKTAVPLDSTATLANVDPTVNFANASITATIITGGDKHDKFIVTEGSGGIDVRGKKVLFNGTEVARTSGGKHGDPLQVTFNGSATQDSVNAVLQHIGLRTTKHAAGGTRTVQFQVNAGGSSSTATIDANIAGSAT